MAAVDAYRQDLPPGLSTGVTQSQIDRARAESVAQRAYDDQLKLYASVVVGVLVVLAVIAAFTHRRKIARAADTAAVASAAAGLRAARKAHSKGRSWQARIPPVN
jgi:hypothetical protein